MAKIGKLFGRVPSLDSKVTDLAGALKRGQISRLRLECSRFRRQFPQLHLAIVCDSVPLGRSLATHGFWLFNSGNLCSDLEKGGLNFHFLLVLDVATQRAHLAVGYGLEPFLAETDLQEILRPAKAPLGDKDYFGAGMAVLTSATEVLGRVSDTIPRAFGLDPRERLD